MLERFSHSGIQSFQKCPAQFQFRYINRIYKKDEGVEAFMGKRVHETLEYLYNQKLTGVILSFDELLKYHFSLWENSWHDRIAIVNKQVLPIDQKKSIQQWKKYAAFYFRLGEMCISKFYKMNQPFKENVYANEYEVDFFLDNDSNYRIKGVIDRLDVDSKGNWVIHDYKTGKRAYSQSVADSDQQLGLYQIGLEAEQDDVNSVILRWHFLQQKRENIIVESRRSDENKNQLTIYIKKMIDKIRKKFEKNEKFEAKTSMLCNWCYYWEECPAKDSPNPFIN